MKEYKSFIDYFREVLYGNAGFSEHFTESLSNIFLDIFILVGTVMSEYEDLFLNKEKEE